MPPLRTADDQRTALAEIESLMAAQPDTAEGDRPNVLVSLVEAWKARHLPIDPPYPSARIVFMMKRKGLTRGNLEPAIGGRARVAEILNRRRALTLPTIPPLSQLLDLPADVLVAKYEVRRTA